MAEDLHESPLDGFATGVYSTGTVRGLFDIRLAGCPNPGSTRGATRPASGN